MASPQNVVTPSDLYDEDYAAWADETAALLRAGRVDEVNLEYVAEEIEALAGRDRREVISRQAVLLQHLLKWRYQSDRRTDSWTDTIREQRRELDILFEQSPSLRRTAIEKFQTAWGRARHDAGDETKLGEKVFPADCPWSLEQILDLDFLPDAGVQEGAADAN